MSCYHGTDSTNHIFCQTCVYEHHPNMMTGYCLRAHKCCCCGRETDCAMVQTAAPRREEEK